MGGAKRSTEPVLMCFVEQDEESSDKNEDEGSEDKEEPEEEEEEEEEELEDPKEKFEEECKESKVCSPAKHHFDECVERVTGADHGKPVDKKHPDEDCVEEFFHLAHCASTCAAPKLWNALK
ncbi:Non-heme 11 kDa protein of cytochrome bc1 complex [Hyaloscypha bicolor E]|uniref:Cytochrome b-c1 complex subunit 6, mitochondrial n=1 Tax=Hyaloscypha bicolor E TaxID=1095630 RepID=A0A2J6T860_9HELO|nr:Non-heme 11 kDa protein of cytochrome bc1 complex [Hyaloscypha bicolor E]PMD59212.1 Non-heme 11 kDa protein of cytochrome bc1 complex [Hyaloscypha bicolor E]